MEDKKEEIKQEAAPEADKFIAEIDSLKKSFEIDKAKIAAERDRYKSALITGAKLDQPKTIEPIEEVTKRLASSKSRTNLEVVRDMCRIGREVINKAGEEALHRKAVDRNGKSLPDNWAEERIEKLESLIEESDGNPRMFNSLYDQYVKESVALPQWNKINNRSK